jgi:trans-aconitate methyltransferase
MDVHGEANLVEHLLRSPLNQSQSHQPYRVLDAGCGTGRTAIELAQRDIEIVGVDLDAVMLQQARAKAPQLDWRLGDLSVIVLDKSFDLIVMAGNVMIYLTPGTEAATVANMAAFELTPPSWSKLTLAVYDQLTTTADLTLVARWSTWEQTPWQPGDRYAVSVHRKK